MPEVIQLSKQAYDLWTKMLEKGGTFTNDDLKELLGKNVPKPLKDELTNNKLIKLQSSKPKQNFIALKVDAKVEIKPEQKKDTKAKKPTVKKPPKQEVSFSDVMVQVNKYCQPYFDKIEELSSELLNLKKIVQNLVGNPTTIQNKSMDMELQKINIDEFYTTLQKVCKELNNSSRYGGLIPIFEVWRLMKQENSSLNRITFQKILLQLENDRKVDLNIANDPSQVRFQESGINVPNRGLIYYISIRA